MISILKTAGTVLIASALSLFLPAAAQVPGISKTPAKPAAAPAQDGDAKLQDWLKEAKAALTRYEDPNAEAQLPEGINAAALADRRRDLDQIVRTINRTLSTNAGLPDVRQQVAEAEAANTNWSGFAEKPPYSLLKLDDLLNQRDATKEKDATFQSSIEIFTKSADGIEAETKALNVQIRDAQAAAEKPDAPEAAKWRLGALDTKARLLAVRAYFVRANLELLRQQAAASAAQLTLLEKQISTVRKNAALTEEDLAAVRKTSDDRRAATREEVAKIRQRLREASIARVRAKAAYDGLNDTTGPARDLASARLTAAEARVDTLQFISDNLESFETLEALIPVAYEDRRTLITSKDTAARQQALKDLRSMLDRLNAWRIVSSNELAAASADLSKQDSNASVLAPDDARQPAISDQRNAIWEKQDFLQRISQTIGGYQRNIARWTDDYEQAQPKTLGSRLRNEVRDFWAIIKGIWNLEVTRSTQTTIGATGLPDTRTKSISLGTIITALTLFLIAYIFAARISRRLQGAVVGRGHMAEAQANTFRTWIMILVSVGLALTTLKYFDIPLTVFAFFGGALAIGLGFGTQTLIKNFISGIIVLFERKIRVGDIIEVDANTSGKVVEINTRSSVVRNADGKETLVPNSLFLENRVTNLTLSNRRVRRNVRVSVAYGSSPADVSAILKECAERHGLILRDPAPVVTLEDFGANSLVFAIYFWVEFNERTDASVVASDIRIMVDKRFSETGIQYPSAAQDMNLKAGEPLRIRVMEPEAAPETPSAPQSHLP